MATILLLGLLPACAGVRYAARDGRLWHPRAPIAVPDLPRAAWGDGWTRVRVPDADLAFSRPGAGVIAVRVRCGKKPAMLTRAARDRWLGIERARMQSREISLHGHSGVDSVAQVRELEARLVVVQVDDCLVDLARVAPRGNPGGEVFESFLAELRLGSAVGEGR